MAAWGGNEFAWGSPTIVGLALAGVVLLGRLPLAGAAGEGADHPARAVRSRVFDVAVAMGFTVGMAMFGAIIFIPLYLQVVDGASATSAGLRMIPLMAGLLVASITSGRVISRIGRYKPFPIAGTAVLTLGMYLLSRLTVDTAPWVASVYMAVVGIGIGLVMQVLVLVVQNNARPRDIGVVTSTATFFRSAAGRSGSRSSARCSRRAWPTSWSGSPRRSASGSAAACI